MDDELQRLIAGPKPIRNFFYDDSANRYFPVPKPGSFGYPIYQQVRDRYSKQLAAERDAILALQPVPPRDRKCSSVYDAIWNIRTGFRSYKSVYSDNIIKKASFIHRRTEHAMNGFPTKSIFAPSSTKNTLLAVDDRDIYELSTIDWELKREDSILGGTATDLCVDPTESIVSVSTTTGELQFYDFNHIRRVQTLGETTIWRHEWISKNWIFSGCDASGTLSAVERDIKYKIDSKKSSVFAIATIPKEKTTFLFGTRAGLLFRADRRSKKSFVLNVSGSSSDKNPCLQLSVLRNAHHVVGSFSKGSVKIFDLRMLRPSTVVMEWELYDKSSHMLSSPRFCLDPDESMMCVVGFGNVSKFYDLTLPTQTALGEHEHSSNATQVVYANEWTSMRQNGFGVQTETGIEFVEMPFL